MEPFLKYRLINEQKCFIRFKTCTNASGFKPDKTRLTSLSNVFKNNAITCSNSNYLKQISTCIVRKILISILYIKNTNKHDYFYIKNTNQTDSVLPVLNVHARDLFF